MAGEFSYDDAAGTASAPTSSQGPGQFSPDEQAFLATQQVPGDATLFRNAHTGELAGYHSPTAGMGVFVGGGPQAHGQPAETAPVTPAGPDQNAEFSYDDAVPATASDTVKPVNEGLGFAEQVTKPLDNLAGWLSKLPVLRSLDRGVASLTGMPTTEDAIASRKAAFQDAEQTQQPGKLGGFAGSVVGTLPAMALPGGVLAQGAASGALLTDHPDSLTDTAKDAAFGAAGGYAGGKVLGALGRVISPRVRPDIQTLVDAGVPLTPGQIAGGAAKRIEDALTSWPILGDAIRSAQRRSLEGFNRAAGNRALEPIGEAVPHTVNVGRDGVGYVQDRLGRAYDAIAPDLRVVFDRPFVDDIATLRAQIAPEALDALPTFDRIVRDEVLQRGVRTNVQTGSASPVAGGTALPTQTEIDGIAAKHAQEAIGAEISGMRAGADPKTRAVVRGLTGLQDLLGEAIERHSPPGARQRLNDINRGYAQFVRVQGASTNASEKADGLFTASQLGRAVKTADKTTRKGAYARGDALMQDLAAAGDRVLPSSVPDSGTAMRLLMSELPMLVGFGAESAHFAPQLAGTLIAGGVGGLPYTRAGQRLTTDLLTRRPWTPPQSAALLARLRPFARGVGAAGAADAGAKVALPQLPAPRR